MSRRRGCQSTTLHPAAISGSPEGHSKIIRIITIVGSEPLQPVFGTRRRASSPWNFSTSSRPARSFLPYIERTGLSYIHPPTARQARAHSDRQTGVDLVQFELPQHHEQGNVGLRSLLRKAIPRRLAHARFSAIGIWLCSISAKMAAIFCSLGNRIPQTPGVISVNSLITVISGLPSENDAPLAANSWNEKKGSVLESWEPKSQVSRLYCRLLSKGLNVRSTGSQIENLPTFLRRCFLISSILDPPISKPIAEPSTKRRWRAFRGSWAQGICRIPPAASTAGRSPRQGRAPLIPSSVGGTRPPSADFLTAETSSAARAAIKRLSLARHELIAGLDHLERVPDVALWIPATTP